MHVALLALALQLQTVALAAPGVRHVPTMADSIGDLRRAQGEQASFERSRRALLPYGQSSGGRCDVRLGRFCWWYDDAMPKFPPEAELITRRRAELLTALDQLGARYPGDDWFAGMRVHYRIDGRDLAGADSLVHSCHATAWWCSALTGYVAHARSEHQRADSAFAAAIQAMPVDSACTWRSIAPLLKDDDRDLYEHLPCNGRGDVERRYWLFSRPMLTNAANDWQNEFYVRRVLARLAERSATPQGLSWGDDAAELLLRYGWPVAWSRIQTIDPMADPSIIGHDPSPSFAFAPSAPMADSSNALSEEAWDLLDVRAEARYAPRLVRRMAGVSAQVARFRRGDSTLVVAAFAAADDSLHTAIASLAAATSDGKTFASTPDTIRAGHAQVMMAGSPVLAGVEVTDTTTKLLARMRYAYAAGVDSARLVLSDLLLYRAGSEQAATLDSALARAIPGDTVARGRPIGLFWESYGVASEGETVDLMVTVERIDHSWFRSTRQRLGITAEDTPIRMKWTDARPPANRATARAISLDLANLDKGRYRVTLTMTPAAGAPVATSRELTLQDR
ncbi:MAG: hypothetical protein ABJE47_14610 [bacterium]